MTSYVTPSARPCTCHSIHEGAGGVTYSDYMIGVLCGYCEAQIAEDEHQAWWESLTPAEQAAQEVSWRWSAAQCRIRYGLISRPRGSRFDEPPF